VPANCTESPVNDLVGGLVKLGWIVNFMSKAVMAGFIIGMAIQIIVGQLGHVTGVQETSGETFQKLWSVLSHVSSWNWTSTVVGLLAIALIFTLQRYLRAVPAALTAVVAASVYVAVTNPDIELVKRIPTGLPSLAVPTGLSGSTWATLLLGACRRIAWLAYRHRHDAARDTLHRLDLACCDLADECAGRRVESRLNA